MIITISGNPGSGKSTIAKALEKELGFKRYYIGGIRREIAHKKGMTLEEYNKLGETDFSTDKEVDDYQKNELSKLDNIIVEGRTSFFLIPESLKVFVDVDINEAARRIYSDLQDDKLNAERNEAIVDSLEEMKQKIQGRIDSDIKRYKKYYGIENAYDKSNFDLIIDTTEGSTKDSVDMAIKVIKEKISEKV